MEELNGNYSNKLCIDCDTEIKMAYKTRKRCRACMNDHTISYNSNLKSKRVKLSNDRYEDIKSLPGECWNFITGYNGWYEISSLGRVKARYRKGGGGLISIQKNSAGYPVVYLKKNVNEPVKCHLIHRLIGTHFIPNPNNHRVVDHIDRNPSNHNISNLRWVSYSQNSQNSKRCDRAGRLNWRVGKKWITYSVTIRRETFRSRHIVQAVKWLFNHNSHLMSHIIREPLAP
jgi:hypothetical protein